VQRGILFVADLRMPAHFVGEHAHVILPELAVAEPQSPQVVALAGIAVREVVGLVPEQHELLEDRFRIRVLKRRDVVPLARDALA